MDYQQSLKNFNELKNLMRPWAECQIFFFFESEIEYGYEIYESDLNSEQLIIIDSYRFGKLPYGYIDHEKNGHEVFYYNDENVTIKYDLFADDCIYWYFHFKADKKLVQQQLKMLTDLLKNK